MDKQKQLNELVKIITKEYPNKFAVSHPAKAIRVATEILKHYQPKIPENAVVLTREEYKTLHDLAMDKCHYDCHLIDYPDFEREKMLRDDTRKETAEKFAERLKEKADMNMCLYGSRIVYVGEIDEICKELGGET